MPSGVAAVLPCRMQSERQGEGLHGLESKDRLQQPAHPMLVFAAMGCSQSARIRRWSAIGVRVRAGHGQRHRVGGPGLLGGGVGFVEERAGGFFLAPAAAKVTLPDDYEAVTRLGGS